jgi:hypothetical protein
MKDTLAAALDAVALSGSSEIVQYAFATSIGIVDVLAELSIRGDTVVLSSVCIYARDAAGIPRGTIYIELLDEKRKLLAAIKDLGWKQLEVTGERASSSSSANPGKHVRLIRKVDS